MTTIVWANLGAYTTVNHTCPYQKNEVISIIAKRYSGDKFALNYLVPAGDYRMNISYALGVERIFVLRFEIHFTISDHRVWH